MTEELLFKGEAAVEYDRAFAHVTRYFMPFLLRAADVGSGMRVLDIATGTGLSAAAVLAVVGPLGEASRLKSLFTEAGFVDIETHTEKHIFVLPSFDAYYGPFERGGASTGQALAALPNEIRRAVREEVQRYFGDTGGPIESETEYRIASGRR
jgi:hypothetical protein